MSPRFQRRPERRSGSGGSGGAGRSGPPARSWAGAGGQSEWRPKRPSEGKRRSGPERPGQRFGERNSERNSERFGERFAERGGDSDGRPQRRFGAGGERRERSFRGDSRSEGRGDARGEGRGDARGEGRRQGSFQDRPDRFRGGSRSASRDGFRDGFRGARRDSGRDMSRDASRDGELTSLGESATHGDTPASDLIWGRHPAQAALESGRPVHRIWCTPELRHTPRFLQLLREAKASGVLVEEVTWARLGQLTGGAVHQGIVLQSAAAETLDLTSLIEGCSQIGEPPLLMAIDGLTDPHNLGAIVRSAEALGAHGMVLPQRRCAGLTGSVAKVAAGALEHLPVARVVNLNRALDTLKQEGYRVVGLAAEGNLSLEEADLEGPLVVVTGSEGDGLSLLTRRSCDQLVRIPLRGATPSLNASVATALLLYEVARRGWMRGLSGQSPAPRIQRPQLPSSAAVEASDTALPDAPEAALITAEPGPDASPSDEDINSNPDFWSDISL